MKQFIVFDNYNTNGSLKDHAGSWEAGVDGLQPGTIMPANPPNPGWLTGRNIILTTQNTGLK